MAKSICREIPLNAKGTRHVTITEDKGQRRNGIASICGFVKL